MLRIEREGCDASSLGCPLKEDGPNFKSIKPGAKQRLGLRPSTCCRRSASSRNRAPGPPGSSPARSGERIAMNSTHNTPFHRRTFTGFRPPFFSQFATVCAPPNQSEPKSNRKRITIDNQRSRANQKANQKRTEPGSKANRSRTKSRKTFTTTSFHAPASGEYSTVKSAEPRRIAVTFLFDSAPLSKNHMARGLTLTGRSVRIPGVLRLQGGEHGNP